MGRKVKCDYSVIPGFVAQGLTGQQMADVLGCSYKSVNDRVKALGLKAQRIPSVFKSRNDKIISMHRQGVNMAKIGAQEGVSRERIRQILERQGVTGKAATEYRVNQRKTLSAETKNARCIAKHGMSFSVYQVAVEGGHAASFRQQKDSAKKRGIQWCLTFGQWFAMWEQSGKLSLRGRGKDHYVMSRVSDAGGYALGNVHIQLSTENNREYMVKNAGKRNEVTGVYLMYPGSSRPWTARLSRKFLGNFTTQQEAVSARCMALSSVTTTDKVATHV